MTKNSKSALVPEYSTPGYIKFLFGGFSGMGATLFVQPLDLVKNRFVSLLSFTQMVIKKSK